MARRCQVRRRLGRGLRGHRRRRRHGAPGTSWQYNYTLRPAELLRRRRHAALPDRQQLRRTRGRLHLAPLVGTQLPEGPVPPEQHDRRRVPLRAERLPEQPHPDRRRQPAARSRVRHGPRVSRGSPCSARTPSYYLPSGATLPRDGMARLRCARPTRRRPVGRARWPKWSGRARPTPTSACRPSAPASKAGGAFARTTVGPGDLRIAGRHSAGTTRPRRPSNAGTCSTRAATSTPGCRGS